MIDKELIKNRFNDKLESYEHTSIVQKQVAEKLIQTLLEFGLTEYGTILEIGAGTGHLSEIIDQELSFQKLILNDIAPLSHTFLQNKVAHDFEFISGDAEHIAFTERVDAIFSSSTLQWFENLPVFFEKAFDMLNSKGMLVLSTFGLDNFKEIREITGMGLDYLPTEELKELISDKFKIVYANDWTISLEFDNAFDVFKHIKQTGVNAIKGEIIQSSQMKEYFQKYEDLFEQDGKVFLTYNPIIIIAQKS